MIRTLFVVEEPELFSGSTLQIISFASYLRDYPIHNEPKTRVINLCDTGRYLSQGYYCSLLAEARHHQVVPSVRVINELRGDVASFMVASNLLHREFKSQTFPCAMVACMGEVEDPHFQKMANWVYQRMPAPIVLLAVENNEHGLLVRLSRVSLAGLSTRDRAFCLETLENFSRRNWHSRSDEKKYRWDMALLCNPEEQVPPSNKGAISRFIKAGEKLGIRTRIITAADFNLLGQYDGLFIRETTAIDHHTYRFAIEAERLGLVVIDDPSSIMRCCNKVYLHDAFTYKKVPSLQTFIVDGIESGKLDEIESSLQYPIILKLPEGSFSKGVFKISDRAELEKIASELLQESALLIAQEYLFTEFDWRIGVLNGRSLYACRYYMAKNHWQIYNHGSQRNFSGGFDALPTFEVPGFVLKAALNAAAAVGDGLYGIDIKTIDNKAYVLEVNDNPSIEHGVEDAYLGEELYMQIMSEFLRRLEARGR